MSPPRTLGTSEERRDAAISASVTVFARGGFHGGTIAQVGEEAGISPAYVFKLFGSKTTLFVEALGLCFGRIAATLNARADTIGAGSPGKILDELGAAYAELIADRSLLMLQVHAQSASAVPEIASALRDGMQHITEIAHSRSGGTPGQVQDFIARGQLCHLLITTSVADVEAPWARILDHGIRHP